MRLFICTPHRENLHPQFAYSYRVQVADCQANGVQVMEFEQPRGTFVSHGRNWGCATAIATSCTHILMWDDDMAINERCGIMQLLSADKPVVSAFCVSRHNGVETHAMGEDKPFPDGMLRRGQPIPHEYKAKPGLYPIGSTGTGILVITTEALWELRNYYVERKAAEARYRRGEAVEYPWDGPTWDTPWFETWMSGKYSDCDPLGLLDVEREVMEKAGAIRGYEKLEDVYKNHTQLDIAHALNTYIHENNEDGVFSYKCRRAGVPMFLDTRVTSRHYGEICHDSAGLIRKAQEVAE